MKLLWSLPLDHACCNSASLVDDRIVHASACGDKVTLLGLDGSVLASRHIRGAHEVFSDGRGGLCLRTLSGLHGLDDNLAATWSLEIDAVPPAIARDGVLHVVARQGRALWLAAFEA